MTQTMRIAMCPAPGRIEIQAAPKPVSRDDDVLVRVAMCGICGTDVAVWRGEIPAEYPRSLGHEFWGAVEETGAAVHHLRVGQRVVINPNLGCGECPYCRAGRPNLCDFLKTRRLKSNGGLAEYVALDARMAYALPEENAGVWTCLVEPLSCALHAAREAGEMRGRVAVFGAGVMGILTALALKTLADEVVVFEPDEWRCQQAGDLLGCLALSPQELTDSAGVAAFDAAVDCSGRMEAVCQAARALRKAGRLVLAGLVVNSAAAALPLAEVVSKELAIKGVWLNPYTFEEALSLAVEHRQTLEGLKTEFFGLDAVDSAFRRAGQHDVHKVIVRM